MMDLKKSLRITTFLLFLFLLSTQSIKAQINQPVLDIEQIHSFDSIIRIKPNNTLHITETITANVQNYKINHGIYRDFPTTYTYLKTFKTKRSFKILNIERNNKPEPYHTEQLANGVRIYIGDANTIVPTGIHTYKIEYITDRQIGVDDSGNYNRLNYNITGNGWEFPILRTSTKIYFDNLTTGMESSFYKNIQTTSYSGETGTLSNLPTAKITNPTLQKPYIEFTLGDTLSSGDGVTLDILFPTGYVEQVTTSDSFFYFINDNIQILISMMLFLLC